MITKEQAHDRSVREMRRRVGFVIDAERKLTMSCSSKKEIFDITQFIRAACDVGLFSISCPVYYQDTIDTLKSYDFIVREQYPLSISGTIITIFWT